MGRLNSLNIRRLTVFVVATILSVLVVLILPTVAQAASTPGNLYPIPADFGVSDKVYLEVANSGSIAGGGYTGLTTKYVYLQIELTDPRAVIHIIDGASCRTNPDIGKQGTKFTVYATETKSSPYGEFDNIINTSGKSTTVTSGQGCAGDRQVNIDLGAYLDFFPATSSVSGREGKYIVSFEAEYISTGGGGLNAFKVTTSDSNARIGLKGNVDAFPGLASTYQDRKSSRGTLTTYEFGFAPPCDYPAGLEVKFGWFDGDWKVNQSESISPEYGVILNEFKPDGTLVGAVTLIADAGKTAPSPFVAGLRADDRDGYIYHNSPFAFDVNNQNRGWVGGGDTYRRYRFVPKAGYKYVMTWNDVIKENGLQVYTPFDSINYGQTCNPPPVSCRVGSRVAALGPRQYVSNLSIDTGNLVEFYSDLTTDGTTTTNIAWNFGGAAANRSFAIPPTNIFDAATENVTFNTASSNYTIKATISYTGGGTSGTYTCSMNVNVEAPPILNWEIVFTGTSADGTPDRVQPGQFWRISYSKLKNVGAGGSYGGGGPTDGQVNIVYTFTGAWGSTPIPNINGLNIDAGSEYAVTTPVDIRIPNVGAGERLCVRQTIQNPTGITGDGPDSGPNLEGAEVCTVVVKRPYLQAFGADVMAGCNAGGGTINAYRKYSYPSFGVQNDAGRGSGAQFGVLAKSSISGFVSLLFGGGKKKLTFANNSTEEYGGKFGANTCTGDYFADEPAATAVGGSNYVVPNGESIKKSGNVRINSGVLTNGTHAELYVTGSAYIGSNIKFSETWNSFKDIPSFKLVVDGDIYIGKNVSQIDGFYIATGTIYTCAESLNNAVLDTNIYARCNRQLTINGSFIANKVKFMRSYGWTKNATNDGSRAAEVFRYNPSLYMVDWDAPSASQSAQTYDSVFTLPPIL